MELEIPAAILLGQLGVWAALRRDQKRTRAMVFAIAKHIGVRVEDGIHVETRTPARGQSIIPTNGEAMKRIIPVLLLGMLLGAIAGGLAGCNWSAADTRKVVDKTVDGAAGGAAGGPPGMLVGAITGLLMGVVGVIGGKAHSRAAVLAADAATAAIQAAHDQVVEHRDQLVDHNAKLSDQLDTAHMLVRLALNPDAPLPIPPGPAMSQRPPDNSAAVTAPAA